MKDGAPVAAFTYELNGNRTSIQDAGGLATAAFDAQDRLIFQGAITCAYTPDGKLRQKSKPGGTTAYTHDALGNLLSVALPDGTRVDYLADGRGRRIGKQVNGVFAGGFLYRDAARPSAEVNPQRGVATLFAHATEERAPDFLIVNAAPPIGVDYYLVKDHAGSVRLAITLQTGAVAQRLDYDAFGSITEDTSPALQPFGFLGGIHDRQTGLVRLGRRDYDPELGRFIARDPDLEAFLAGETNLYALRGNDPVNHPREGAGHRAPRPLPRVGRGVARASPFLARRPLPARGPGASRLPLPGHRPLEPRGPLLRGRRAGGGAHPGAAPLGVAVESLSGR